MWGFHRVNENGSHEKEKTFINFANPKTRLNEKKCERFSQRLQNGLGGWKERRLGSLIIEKANKFLSNITWVYFDKTRKNVSLKPALIDFTANTKSKFSSKISLKCLFNCEVHKFNDIFFSIKV